MKKQPPRNANERVFLYVPHAWVEEAVRLGWEDPSDLGPPHNNYSVLMEWKRDDEPVMPFKAREKRDEGR